MKIVQKLFKIFIIFDSTLSKAITISLSIECYHFILMLLIARTKQIVFRLTQWAMLPLSLPNRPLNSTFAIHLPTDLLPTSHIGEEAASTQIASVHAASEAALASFPGPRAILYNKRPHDLCSSLLTKSTFQKLSLEKHSFNKKQNQVS